jgi:hypothetical protein
MLAGIPVPAAASAELTAMVRAAGADDLAERLDQALDDDVKLLALTIDERAIILATLEEPPDGLAELRGVLMNEARMEKARRPELDDSTASRVRSAGPGGEPRSL